VFQFLADPPPLGQELRVAQPVELRVIVRRLVLG
jgi:hypothetical protein